MIGYGLSKANNKIVSKDLNIYTNLILTNQVNVIEIELVWFWCNQEMKKNYSSNEHFNRMFGMKKDDHTKSHSKMWHNFFLQLTIEFVV